MTTLIITEKPTAARRIALALADNGEMVTKKNGRVQYYLTTHKNKQLIIVSALGHLFGLKQKNPEKGWTYPVFEYEWVPLDQVSKKNNRVRPFINTIKQLAKKAEYFISACDYDTEGSLIGYLVLKNILGEQAVKHAKRMHFSTLTKSDLEEAFETPDEHLNFNLIEAARARHEIDWLFGINLSRALTLAVKNASKRFQILSTGRVQGPTLQLLVTREEEIRTFIPIPYWTILGETRIDTQKIPLYYVLSKIECRQDALMIVEACKNKVGTIERIAQRTSTLLPPYAFDLGTLQSEAYRHFKYSPKHTLSIAEKLYLDALISYPRTSSQKLPSSLNIPSILHLLSSQKNYSKICEDLFKQGPPSPRQGPREDPAHPAIHPTGKKPISLSSQEKRLYDLITRRFLSTMGKPAKKESVRADINVEGYGFYLKGVRTLDAGWTKIYHPYFSAKEILLPPLSKGQQVPVTEISTEDRFSEPPPRYNPASILREMEKLEIGTKATRADIIDRLQKRNYVEGTPAKVSDIGLAVVNILGEQCPEILSVEMTRHLEKQMENIQLGSQERSTAIKDAINALERILTTFHDKEKSIGLAIFSAITNYQEKSNIIGPCPKCETGTLKITYSKKTKKRFIGCSNYSDPKIKCTNSYPISQRGKIFALNQPCPHCNTPMISLFGSTSKSRIPLKTCVNWVNCPGRQKTKKGRS